jgi:hypothetical protein
MRVKDTHSAMPPDDGFGRTRGARSVEDDDGIMLCLLECFLVFVSGNSVFGEPLVTLWNGKAADIAARQDLLPMARRRQQDAAVGGPQER